MAMQRQNKPATPIIAKSERRFGVLKGKIKIFKEFGAPLPDSLVLGYDLSGLQPRIK